nr:G-type lectin S-receptor-like serine/threonine-protein kinase CES101 isoform X2 [Ziziphus jujuba var. spinosa]
MGKLMISYKGGDPIVLYKGSKFAAVNTSATLLDNGNFVLREMNSNGSAGMVLWESFAYPTDTLLPGMKLGVSHKTGQRWSLTSWLADDTPATGAFTLEWDPKGVQLVMRRQGMIYWNSGAIKRDSFGGGTFFDFVSSTSIYDLKNVTNEEEEYFTYSVNNEYDEQYRKGKSKLLLDYKGLLQDADRLQIINVEECYGYNTDDGCAKWEQPKCRGSNMKFETRSGGFTKPAGDYDMGVYDNNGSLSRSDCRAQCWNDCDCLGFRANGGTGCLFWRGKDLKFEQDYSGATVRLDLLVKSSSGESLSSKSLSWNSNASINQNIV